MTNTYCSVYSVETPDDGQQICPKHVQFFIKINLRNSASCWLVLYEFGMGIVLKVKEYGGGVLGTCIWNTHKDYYIRHTCITFVTKYKQPDIPTVTHECTVCIPKTFL